MRCEICGGIVMWDEVEGYRCNACFASFYWENE